MPLPPRIQWKLNRYSREIDDRLAKAKTLMQSVWSKQKMCPACRALVDRRENVCPLCGERMYRGSGGVLDGLVSHIIPDQIRYSVFILTANVILFAMTLLASMKRMGGEPGLSLLLGSIDSYTLVRFGAKYGPLIQAGEWWRFLTPVFLHGSLLHLGMNSWVLLDLGPAVEALYGRQRFLVLYVVTGIGGNLLSYWWRPFGVGIGASGAIFGLIGAMITYGYRNRRSVADATRNMFVRWAIYGLIFGFLMPMIDNAAHIGGLLSGMAFGLIVSDMPSVTSGSIYFWKAMQAMAALLILGAFLMVGLYPPI